jgi:hypothetical protein
VGREAKLVVVATRDHGRAPEIGPPNASSRCRSWECAPSRPSRPRPRAGRCGRGPASRPSEMSIAAVARPRSACPSFTAGMGS